MGRERKFKGTNAEQALARFLCDITESLGLDTVNKVAERFPCVGGRTKWAEYLNGSKLIPKDLLGKVLIEVRRTRPEHRRESLITEAHTLWKSAATDTVSPLDGTGTELVSVYRKLAENAEALRKAQEVELRSERVISRMNERAGQQEIRIADLERDLEHLQEKERGQVAHRLEQTRFRLTRIDYELEHARSDRYTVEQARRVLLREQQEIRLEFERLQQDANNLGLFVTEPTILPELLAPQLPAEEIDRAVDEELDLIGTDRKQRGLMLSEVLEQASVEPETEKDGLRFLLGTVVTEHTSGPGPSSQASTSAPSEVVPELSKTTSDNPATSDDTPAHSPVVPPKQWAVRRKIIFSGLAIAFACVTVVFINVAQGGDGASTQGSDGASTQGSDGASTQGSDDLSTQGGDDIEIAKQCFTRDGPWKLHQKTGAPTAAHNVKIYFAGSSTFVFNVDGTGVRIDKNLKEITNFESMVSPFKDWAPVRVDQDGKIEFHYSFKKDKGNLKLIFTKQKGKITREELDNYGRLSSTSLKLADSTFSCTDEVLTITTAIDGSRSDSYIRSLT
ncbi:hypothetical protein ABTX35_16060 [Streptomyces sp. NPDC096080]|uniref:hypothetical protein n=1 Tax=Streptomyces sp. NPDC096080 TaxID=3156693 RepID=UPI0033223F96